VLVHHSRNASIASVERIETKTTGLQAHQEDRVARCRISILHQRTDGTGKPFRSGLTGAERKVKGLLNKLTMEKFASISDRIIAWANKSEKEKDGRTLILVIRLVFGKAMDERGYMVRNVCTTLQEDDGADRH
jgi:hypothetical protein